MKTEDSSFIQPQSTQPEANELPRTIQAGLGGASPEYIQQIAAMQRGENLNDAQPMELDIAAMMSQPGYQEAAPSPQQTVQVMPQPIEPTQTQDPYQLLLAKQKAEQEQFLLEQEKRKREALIALQNQQSMETPPVSLPEKKEAVFEVNRDYLTDGHKVYLDALLLEGEVPDINTVLLLEILQKMDILMERSDLVEVDLSALKNNVTLTMKKVLELAEPNKSSNDVPTTYKSPRAVKKKHSKK